MSVYMPKINYILLIYRNLFLTPIHASKLLLLNSLMEFLGTNTDIHIKEFLSRYDFWFRRLIDLTSLSTEKDETFYVETLINLYTELKNNVVMQKILLWELTKNETAKEFANLRERLNLGLMAYYVGQFDMAKFDIACTTSILISAIYYLILHKDISTFCGIDYSTESGDERIKKTLKDIGHLIFIRHRIAQQREKFCDFLTEKGLTSEDIEHCKTMIF